MDNAVVIVGDALQELRKLPSESVDCVLSSPPYWGLRDYENPGQIGLEATVGEYVARLLAVFAECRRVLAPHGTFWLNLGDTYASKTRGSDLGWDKSRLTNPGTVQKAQSASLRNNGERHRGKSEGFKPKDLVGVPWRVALALQENRWWLRSDVIWAKTNPMPGPWRDRPTSAHEHVFLLAKSARYWFDTEAVREPYQYDGRRVTHIEGRNGSHQHRSGERWPGTGRNVRDVWTIATEPYHDAHFATMPTALAQRCVLAGCPRDVCTECGKARERIVESVEASQNGCDLGPRDRDRGGRTDGFTKPPDNLTPIYSTLGWTDCGHDNYRPGIVLDPFLGSGTTAVAALREHRHAIGIELSPEYADLARTRIKDWHRKPPRPPAAPIAQGTLL